MRIGVHHLGDAHRQQALGESRSCVERESGVAGRGHCQLLNEHGKFCVDDGTTEMVRCQGIHATKRQSHRCTRGAGAREVSKVSRGHTPG